METQNITKTKLIAKYHILASRQGMTEEDRYSFLTGNFQKESSSELNETQLIKACNLLSGHVDESDKWRKRVIAAICGWLKKINMNAGIENAKAIACRAAQYDNFNKIPESKLRDIYYAFVRKAKTEDNVAEVKNDYVEYLQTLN